MTIEYAPRSRREEDGWRTPNAAEHKAYFTQAPVAVHGEADGQPGVRVAVRAGGLRMPHAFVRPWVLIVVLVNGGNLLRGLFSGRHGTFQWSWWLSALVAMVLLVALYRALRLHRFSGRDRLDIVLTPLGVHTRGLVVPWSAVTEVVRFNFMFGPGPGGPGPRNYIALRVEDFVAVRGLTPFRAGLANLTRRHLVVLVLAVEVRDARALVHALGVLVADPEARELLTTDAGLSLVGGTT